MADLILHIQAKDDASGTLKGIQGEVRGVGTAAKDVSTVAMGTLGADALKGALSGAASAISGTKDKLGEMISASSDLSESTSKASVVFGDSFAFIEDAASNAAKTMGLSKQAFLEFAGTFGNLFSSMGLGGDAAAEMSNGILELAADLASFNNMEVTDVLDKLRAGLTGESEPLKALGVNINAAMIEAKALELGLVPVTVNLDKVKIASAGVTEAEKKAAEATKKYGAGSLEAAKANAALTDAQAKLEDSLAGQTGEIDAAAKAQASLSLIYEQTTLAQGDFARTSDGLANQQRILKAEQENLAASMGGKLLPVQLAAIKAFKDLPPQVQTATFVMQKFGPEMLTGAGALGQAVIGFKAIGPALTGIGPAIGGVTTAMRGMSMAMLTPPLGIIVALAAIGVAAYIFRDDIIGAFGAAADFVVPIVKDIGGAIMGAFNTVLDFFKGNWQTIAMILAGPFLPIVALATDAFGVRSALVGAFNAVLGFVKSNWPEIATIISGPFLPMVALATDAFGVRSALIGAFTSTVETVKGIVVGGFNAVKDFITSTLTAAKNTVESILLDIGAVFASSFERIRVRVISIVQGVYEGIVSIINRIVDFVRDKVDWILDKVRDAREAVDSIPVVGGILSGLAAGGPVSAGVPYIVGEQGPELFVPATSGHIIPNDQLRSTERLSAGTVNRSFALNIYGPLTVQNIGPLKDTRKVMGDLAFTMAAEMRARGILAA